MKIEFHQPLNFYMEVIETDDHVPSMQVQVKVSVAQFQNIFQYEGYFWIACKDWDLFKNSLYSPEEDAILKDMNGNSILRVYQDASGNLMLSWMFKKEDIVGERKMNAEFLSRINGDILGEIKEKFTEFPSWW